MSWQNFSKARRQRRRALAALPEGARPLRHSDRGCRYCSRDYIETLQSAGLEISITEKRYCYENALTERVNGMFKQEYDRGARFRTKAAALKAIEVKRRCGSITTGRPHTALNDRTPAEVHRAAV